MAEYYNPDPFMIVQHDANFNAIFQDYTAHKLQAHWHGHKQRRLYLKMRLSAVMIQRFWRNAIAFRKAQPDYTGKSAIIQRCWRRYSSVRIYRYYRDLIRFRERGDPKVMLRSINPREAHLAEAASGIHVRFRLGGSAFPPLVFYKIFTHRPVADMCSFSPKDYVAARKANPEVMGAKHNKEERPTPGKPMSWTEEGWYQRVENNGWRPLAARVLVEVDPVSAYTASKTMKFHHDPLVRREEQAIKRKERQRAWMKRMYREGRKGREGGGEDGAEGYGSDGGGGGLSDIDEEEDDLLRWSEALDFEAYTRDWSSMATSGRSEMNVPVPETWFSEDMASFAEQYTQIIGKGGGLDGPMEAY